VGVPLAFGGHNEFEHFLAPVFEAAGHVHEHIARGPEVGLAIGSVLVALLGFAAAWWLYYKKPGTAGRFATGSARPLYALLDHKYWVDELYGKLILAPLLFVSRIGLGMIVDTGIVEGVPAAGAAGTRGLASITRRMQSGNIRSYAGWLALGAAAVFVLAALAFHHHI
jgi:NADH-quinone oxidoreductase subunit L